MATRASAISIGSSWRDVLSGNAMAATNGPKRPARGSSVSPFRGHGSSVGATWRSSRGANVSAVSALVATGRRLVAAGSGTRVPVDVTIAAVVFVGSLALLAHGLFVTGPGARRLDPVGVVLVAGTALPLMAWRSFPLGVFALTGAAGVLLAGLGYPVDLVLGPIVALYLLAASREPQARWTGRATVVVGLLVAYLVAAGIAKGTFPGLVLLHSGLSWAVAWFAGERTRLRREHVDDLRRRALRAEHDAERERLLAVAEERARIARDLHDSAGHAISVIAVRAGAARLRHRTDPDRSVSTLEAIEELARRTVADIDQLVGTLREGPAGEAVEAPAGLVSLETLIAQYAAAGLRLRVNVTGTPRSIGGAADQAAYRILQEALTNAARHGAGSAQVELAFDHGAVELTVTNPVRAGGTPRTGGGHGLIGMRERATLRGGCLHAARTNGTFRVQARIPTGRHRS